MKKTRMMTLETMRSRRERSRRRFSKKLGTVIELRDTSVHARSRGATMSQLRYAPRVSPTAIQLADKVTPSWIVSHNLPLDDAPDAYAHFDARDDGWTKVVLNPTSS